MSGLIMTGSEQPVQVASIDLDGTLLDRRKRISAENAAAVELLRAAGFEIVLTSGRILQHTLAYYRQLALSGPIVSADGALVRVPGRKPIHDVTLAPDVVFAILDTARRLKVTAMVFRHDGIRTTSRFAWNDEIDRHRRELPRHYRESKVERVWRTPTHKVLLYATSDELAQLEAALPDFVSQQTHRIRNTATLEFTSPGISKVAGLASMFKPAQVTFFGDGNNDVAVLRWAGLGVAMHHGTEAALAAADLIAPCTDPAINFAAAVELILPI